MFMVFFNPKKLFFNERPDQIGVTHQFDDCHLILSVKAPLPVSHGQGR